MGVCSGVHLIGHLTPGAVDRAENMKGYSFTPACAFIPSAGILSCIGNNTTKPASPYLLVIPLEALISFPASFWSPFAYVWSSSDLKTGVIKSKRFQSHSSVTCATAFFFSFYLCCRTPISSLQKYSPSFDTRLTF